MGVFMKKSILTKIGWILIIAACFCWISLIIIPFFQLSFAEKAFAATVCVVLGEVFFWLGTIIIGKDVFHKFKQKLKRKKYRTP